MTERIHDPGTGPGRRDETCVAPATPFPRAMQRRWRVFAGIFLVYLGYALPDLWNTHAWPGRVAGIVLLLAFVGTYLGPLPVAAFGSRPSWRPWVVAVMVAIPA